MNMSNAANPGGGGIGGMTQQDAQKKAVEYWQ